MNKKIESVAYHEAGHTIAYILADIPFKFVTIKQDDKEDEHGQLTLGKVVPEKHITSEDWCQYSMLNLDDFLVCFKEDFINIAGVVAERIYRGRFNYRGAKSDINLWIDTTLEGIPEKLVHKYQSFMMEYAFQVLQTRMNWSSITAIASELLEKETLNYNQVREIIKQKLMNLNK